MPRRGSRWPPAGRGAAGQSFSYFEVYETIELLSRRRARNAWRRLSAGLDPALRFAEVAEDLEGGQANRQPSRFLGLAGTMRRGSSRGPSTPASRSGCAARPRLVRRSVGMVESLRASA